MDINQRIEIADENLTNSDFMPNPTVIKVVGVGNGGCNAVNRMIEEGLSGVSFIAMNTDAQQLSRSKADVRVVLGKEITGGMGAGTDPDKGAEAARRDEKKIAAMLEGADLVFVASGFGGGTGTGASPIIASIAKGLGALTIGVVTKPFEDEGRLKMSRAEKGIEQMSTGVDSLVVIPNENLNGMIDENITFEESFRVVDDILHQAVQGISNIINETGEGINVDFADVQTMIKNSNGRAHLGIGYGKGEKRTERAVTNALNNPLLDVENIRNASGILANIVCPKDFARREYVEAMKIISHYASDDANKKIGVCQREDMHDEVRVTVIATGFEHGKTIENDTTSYDETTGNTFDTNSSHSSTTNKYGITSKYSSSLDESLGNSVSKSINTFNEAISRDVEKISELTAPVETPQPVQEPIQEQVTTTTYANDNNDDYISTSTNNNQAASIENVHTNYNTNEPVLQTANDDADIQEAINIANSIKNSTSRNYTNSVNQTQEPVVAYNDNRTTIVNANNTQETRANSEHIVEQKNQNSTSDFEQYNTNSRYDNVVEPEPLLEEKQDSEYVYQSLKSMSPHSGQEYLENANYGVDILPREELSRHRDLFDKEEPQIYDDTDIDTPAFLRRAIQTKK